MNETKKMIEELNKFPLDATLMIEYEDRWTPFIDCTFEGEEIVILEGMEGFENEISSLMQKNELSVLDYERIDYFKKINNKYQYNVEKMIALLSEIDPTTQENQFFINVDESTQKEFEEINIEFDESKQIVYMS